MRRTFTKEAHVKEAVREILKARAIWYFMPSMNGMGRQGIPDFICCGKQGRFLAIETKLDPNKPTAHQRRELDKLLAQGALALVVTQNDLDQFERLLGALGL